MVIKKNNKDIFTYVVVIQILVNSDGVLFFRIKKKHPGSSFMLHVTFTTSRWKVRKPYIIHVHTQVYVYVHMEVYVYVHTQVYVYVQYNIE